MAQQPRLIEDHIRKNKRDTVIICMLMVVLLFSVIFAVGLILGAPPTLTMMIGLPIALFYILITYSFSVQSVISAARARPANPQIREEKILIYKVEEMALAAGLPTPKVYVQESKDINAFATGHKPEDSIICATTGALQQLNTAELEGVIGHEMSHIRNRDILVMTVTVGVVGAIALLAEIAFRMLFWGAATGRGGGGKKDQGNIIVVVIAIIFVILAPIFSRLTYLAISRRREYLADADGAYLTRNPEGLAKALEKIKGDLPDDPKGAKTVAPLYIANPFKRARKDSIWSTHPPLEERIRRLRSM
jgi:heat shock protein HtpX